MLGQFRAIVERKRRFEVLTFYIAKQTSNCMGSLLGLDAATSLGLINIVNNVNTPKRDDEVNTILRRFTPIAFCDKIGKMVNETVSLSIDPGIQHVAMRHRRIPFQDC